MAIYGGLHLKMHREAIGRRHQGYQAVYTRRRAFRASIARGRFQCLALALRRSSSIPWYIPAFERNLKLQIGSLIKKAYHIPNPY
jgi:hypothetical protein